jgi:hypothetical protein
MRLCVRITILIVYYLDRKSSDKKVRQMPVQEGVLVKGDGIISIS